MTKQVIAVRRDLNMRKGKLAAQVAHASMAFLSSQIRNQQGVVNDYGSSRYEIWLPRVRREWIESSFTKVVVSVGSAEELLSLVKRAQDAGIVTHEIVDNGATEFHGVPTLTCAAFGPDESERLDPFTGDLPLL